VGGQGLSIGIRRGPALPIVVAVVVMDQLTKLWAVAVLEDGPIELIGDFLALRITRNPGAAFSSFGGGGTAIGVAALLVAATIAVLLPRVERRIEEVALALILGGAIGNLFDRVFRGEGVLDGAVVDFVDFSFFPTFNVADSAITVGAALLVIGAVFLTGHGDREDAAGGAEGSAEPDGSRVDGG
jgi:signal peptidase II